MKGFGRGGVWGVGCVAGLGRREAEDEDGEDGLRIRVVT